MISAISAGLSPYRCIATSLDRITVAQCHHSPPNTIDYESFTHPLYLFTISAWLSQPLQRFAQRITLNSKSLVLEKSFIQILAHDTLTLVISPHFLNEDHIVPLKGTFAAKNRIPCCISLGNQKIRFWFPHRLDHSILPQHSNFI